MKKRIRRQALLRSLLCLALLAALAATLSACGREEPITAVYAASDFQPYDGNSDDVEQGVLCMETILRKMKKDGYPIGGALLCGDYSKTGNTWSNVDPALSNSGVAAIAGVLEAELGLGHGETVYVQGNHDPADTEGLDPFGPNDSEHYGVFVLHEDNFRWKQGVTNKTGNENAAEDAKTAAADAAARLEDYLRDKAEQKYEKPIFVCSHVPLHFSYRTLTMSSQDNIHAKLIFDVLNEYGRQLNIIFLFGHNHSDTHDDYLGGGAIYLPEGDSILVDDGGDSRTFTAHTLNFTYLNAGYLGYYDGKCAGSGLTSTVLAIYPDRVEIARYSFEMDGDTPTAARCAAKGAGTWDKGHSIGSFDKELNDTTVYDGVQTVTLKRFPTEE